MDTNGVLTLKIVRQLKIEPDVLFDALTKPENMRVWWTDDTEFDIDLRPGGQWKILRKEGEMILHMTGKYLEIDRPSHLKYTIAMPQFSPNSDVVSFDIRPLENVGCEVTFIQSGKDISSELQHLEDSEVSASEKGWQQGFDLIAQALEP